MNDKTVFLFGGGVLVLLVLMSRASTKAAAVVKPVYVTPPASNEATAITGALGALSSISSMFSGGDDTGSYSDGYDSGSTDLFSSSSGDYTDGSFNGGSLF